MRLKIFVTGLRAKHVQVIHDGLATDQSSIMCSVFLIVLDPRRLQPTPLGPAATWHAQQLQPHSQAVSSVIHPEIC